MAWTFPKTWAAGEMATAALMNTHVRDNMNLLKTRMDDAGLLQSRYGGNVNTYLNTDAGETDGYLTTLSAGVLASAGDCLEFNAGLIFAANADTKTLKLYVGADSATLYTGAANGLTATLFLRLVYINATTVYAMGVICFPASNTLIFADITADCSIDNTMKFTLQGAATADFGMYSLTCGASRI